MKNKYFKKKGFTLIELLAVITVLAIIALIAVPLTLKVIDRSNKKALEASAKSIIKAGDEYQTANLEDSEDVCVTFDFSKKITTRTLTDGVVYMPISDLKIKGDVPKSGTLIVCKGGIVLNINNDKYRTTGTNNDNITIYDYNEEDNDANISSPQLLSYTKTVNSDSIQLTLNTSDTETYIYYLDGKEYTSCTTNVCNFSDLVSRKTYEIKVILGNTNGIPNTKTVKLNASTKGMGDPTIEITPSGYATSKKVKIKYETDNYINHYTVLSGTVKDGDDTVTVGDDITFADSTKNLIFSTDGSIAVWTENDATGETSNKISQIITQIDNTAPSISLSATNPTSNSIKLVATCSDESGISKYEFSKDNGETWVKKTSSQHIFNDLSTGTYNVKARCTNGAGLTSVKASTVAVNSSGAPTINLDSASSATTYQSSKKVNITYFGDGVKQYRIDSGTTAEGSVGTWYTVSGSTKSVTFTSNGTITAREGDDLLSTTYSISKIDNSQPGAAINLNYLTANKANVTGVCNDDESGISKIDFYYRLNGATNYTLFNSSSVAWASKGSKTIDITGLDQDKDYDFMVKCYNNILPTPLSSTASKENSSTKGLEKCSISSDNSSWSKSKTASITCPLPPENSTYTYKYNVKTGAGVINGTTVSASGSYNSSSNTGTMTFNQNSTITATVCEGNICKESDVYTIDKIDNTAPVISSLSKISGGSKKIEMQAVCGDETNGSGVNELSFSNDNGSTYSGIYSPTKGSENHTFTGLTGGKTYNMVAKCADAAGNVATKSVQASTISLCAPTITVPSGWATSKNVVINYTCGGTFKYKGLTGTAENIVNGEENISNTSSKTIKYRSNGSGSAWATDGTENSSIVGYTVSGIDTTAPTCSLNATSSTSNKVNLTAACSDTGGSGVKSYYFGKSNDDGSITWSSAQTSNSYSGFNDLIKEKNYTFYVYAKDNVGNGDESNKASATSTTQTCSTPTITVENSETWDQSKKFTITYPADSNCPYHRYRVSSGTVENVTTGQIKEVGSTTSSQTVTLTMTSNGGGSVQAIQSDDLETNKTKKVVNETIVSKTTDKIDTVKPRIELDSIQSEMGSNGWFRSYKIRPYLLDEGESGIASTTYEICEIQNGSVECSNSKNFTFGDVITFPNSSNKQFVQIDVKSGSGVTGTTTGYTNSSYIIAGGLNSAVLVDGSSPTAMLTGSDSTWTSSNRTVSLTGGAVSDIAKYEMCQSTSQSSCTGTWFNGTSLTISSSFDGYVLGKVTSYAGNASNITATTVKIDKVVPSTPSSYVSIYEQNKFLVPLTYRDKCMSNQGSYIRKGFSFTVEDTGPSKEWSEYQVCSTKTNGCSGWRGDNNIANLMMEQTYASNANDSNTTNVTIGEYAKDSSVNDDIYLRYKTVNESNLESNILSTNLYKFEYPNMNMGCRLKSALSSGDLSNKTGLISLYNGGSIPADIATDKGRNWIDVITEGAIAESSSWGDLEEGPIVLVKTVDNAVKTKSWDTGIVKATEENGTKFYPMQDDGYVNGGHAWSLKMTNNMVGIPAFGRNSNISGATINQMDCSENNSDDCKNNMGGVQTWLWDLKNSTNSYYYDGDGTITTKPLDNRDSFPIRGVMRVRKSSLAYYGPYE